jgi:hypothetical protein
MKRLTTIVGVQSGRGITGFPPAVPGGSWRGKSGRPTGAAKRSSTALKPPSRVTGRKRPDNLVDINPRLQERRVDYQLGEGNRRNVRESMGLPPEHPTFTGVVNLNQFRPHLAED